MGRIRHKRKNSHLVFVTSDAVDAGFRQYRIRPWVMQTIIFVLCVIIGVMIGYIIYEKDIWAGRLRQTGAQQDVIDMLVQEKTQLECEVADLNDAISELNQDAEALNEQLTILRASAEQKEKDAENLTRELEKLWLPTEFPLTGAVTMTEGAEGENVCLFTAAAGAMVVATAKGTVMAVNDDSEYGHNVWVDHGNGYVTVYRCRGEVKVKQGEAVMPGTTIFLTDDNSNSLCYQMMKDGAYINPMSMLAISG